MSVPKPLQIGVSSPTISDERARTASSGWWFERSMCPALSRIKQRSASMYAFWVISMRRTSACSMMGDSLAEDPTALPWMRSWAYCSACW